MDTFTALLRVALIVAVINAMPAFMPPTWSVLAYFRVHDHLPLVPLVLVGACSAAAGRVVLAVTTRRLSRFVPQERRRHLKALGIALSQGRLSRAAMILVFVFSPVPSNAIFEAAGLAQVPLRPLVAAFICGRIVSDFVYVSVASAAARSLTALFRQPFSSPTAILLQLAALVAVVGLVFVNWISVIDTVRARVAALLHKPAPPSIAEQLEEVEAAEANGSDGKPA